MYLRHLENCLLLDFFLVTSSNCIIIDSALDEPHRTQCAEKTIEKQRYNIHSICLAVESTSQRRATIEGHRRQCTLETPKHTEHPATSNAPNTDRSSIPVNLLLFLRCLVKQYTANGVQDKTLVRNLVVLL